MNWIGVLMSKIWWVRLWDWICYGGGEELCDCLRKCIFWVWKDVGFWVFGEGFVELSGEDIIVDVFEVVVGENVFFESLMVVVEGDMISKG